MKVGKDPDPPPRRPNHPHRCGESSAQRGGYSPQRSALRRTGPGWCSGRFWPDPVPLLKGKSAPCRGWDMTSSLCMVWAPLEQGSGWAPSPFWPRAPLSAAGMLLTQSPRCWCPLGNCLGCSWPPGPRSCHLPGGSLHPVSGERRKRKTCLLCTKSKQLWNTVQASVLHPTRSLDAFFEMQRSPTTPSAPSCFLSFLSPGVDPKSTPHSHPTPPPPPCRNILRRKPRLRVCSPESATSGPRPAAAWEQGPKGEVEEGQVAWAQEDKRRA